MMSATNIYLTVEGAKQGKFKGDVSSKSKPNAIRCYYYGYAVNSSREAGSGAAVGKRQHSPIVLHKAINDSSPQFMQALIQGEVLKKVTIELRSGSKVLYTISLKNAAITSIEHSVPEIDEMPDAVEEIELVCQEIKFESADGTSVKDQWTAHA